MISTSNVEQFTAIFSNIQLHSLDFRKVRDMSEEETKVIAEEKEEETADDSASMPPPPEKAVEIEKMEEQKLKSKFPGNQG